MFDSRLFSAIRAEVFIWKSVTLQLSKLWFSVSCLYSGRLSNYLSGFCKNAPANRTFSPLNVKLNIRARKTVVIFHFSKSSTSLRIVQTVVTSSSFQRPSTAHEETGASVVAQWCRVTEDKTTILFSIFCLCLSTLHRRVWLSCHGSHPSFSPLLWPRSSSSLLPFRPLCPTGDPHFLFPTLIFYPLLLYCFFAFPSLPETSVNPPGQRSPNFSGVLYFTLVHFKVLYALKCSGALLNSNQLNIQTSGLLFILFLDTQKCFFFCPTRGQTQRQQ